MARQEKPVVVYALYSGPDDKPIKRNYTVDGFSWGGFFLGPVWLLFHGSWILWLICQVVWIAYYLLVGLIMEISPYLDLPAFLLLHIAFGATAWKIKRYSLLFRGYEVLTSPSTDDKLLAIRSAFGRF